MVRIARPSRCIEHLVGDGSVLRILIVEDEPMIALNLEDLLVEAGYEVTCVAGKRKGACANRRRRLRCGHRRCQLAGVSASPAALALAARGLPFIVLSGYSPDQLQGAFPAALFMKKPYRADKLIHTLKTMVLKQ